MNEIIQSLREKNTGYQFFFAVKYGVEDILEREKIIEKKRGKIKSYYFYPKMDLYFWIYENRFSILLEFEDKTYTITGKYEITLNNSGNYKEDDNTKTVEEKNIKFSMAGYEHFKPIISKILNNPKFNKHIAIND